MKSFKEKLNEDTLYGKEDVPKVGDIVDSVKVEMGHWQVKFQSGKTLMLAMTKDEKREVE